nr:immunoglobulin light chain junction region [Mus musculus]
CQQWSSYPTF